jgi:hypothetical protein
VAAQTFDFTYVIGPANVTAITNLVPENESVQPEVSATCL